MSNKIIPLHAPEQAIESWGFFCPGCRHYHAFRTKGPEPVWTWNGSLAAPTFSPSLLVRHADNALCHLFVHDGKIQFLNDSTHPLAGQTVQMEPDK